MNTLEKYQTGRTLLTKREKAVVLRRQALHLKYEKAVRLYETTDKSLKNIAEECNLSIGGLGSYLRRYWRELVLRRHGIVVNGENLQSVKIIETGKQNTNAHTKYKDAVAACESLTFIDLNISQIARKYGVSATALTNFMRIHYHDILVWRDKVRKRLGINEHIVHGARRQCIKQYAKAVELYKDTDMTMSEIAEACNVSLSGFSQHMRFYHSDILKAKRKERKISESNKTFGKMTGNGRTYKPSAATEAKYAEALTLYKDTAMTMKDIAAKTGVSAEGLRSYLHKWHKDLVLERLGITGNVDENTDLRKAKKRLKTVAAKYAGAIESLRQNPRPIARVAAEYGFHTEVFRDYLSKHEPELLKCHSVMSANNGKRVFRRSEEKYSAAVKLYETTPESLKSISKRLGLTYNSLGGYIRRNYPEVITHHRDLL